MSLLEILGIAAGWAAVIFVVVTSCRRFCARQPKRAASPICPSSSLTSGLRLSTQHLLDIQDGVLAVGTGAARVATLGFDYVNECGPGSIVVVVVDGALCEQVIAPAIMRRLAMRSGT